MTLSRFLRDYLYFPLGGNRHGKFRRYANLMVTMLLGGLWHGAGWTFVIWGGLHGLYLMINHAQRAIGPSAISSTLWFRLVSRITTFLAVLVAWVFFRASDLASAGRVLSGMIGLHGLTSAAYTKDVQPGLLPLLDANPWIWIAALLAISWLAPNSQELIAFAESLIIRFVEQNKRPVFQATSLFIGCLSFLLSLLLFIITISVIRDAESPFIYFNF
jgi:hypothetical protein